MDDPIVQLLASLADDGQLVHVEREPARPSRTGTTLEPTSRSLLESFGVKALWTHQAAAIDHIRAGRSVVIATGTASGKSLCYQLPIVEAIESRPSSALLLFPTKALAQDQLRSFTELRRPSLIAATYDGDTSTEARIFVRRNASVVLTNPEMLHAGILATHGRWATFFRRLQFVVIDELHVLRGVFGTNVSHLLRRLRRVCALYGSSPTFVFSSATIGEPAALASALCGLPVHAISDDGSPRGERLVALWNPALIDAELGIRTSSTTDTARVMRALIAEHCRTVAFCRSRRTTEKVALTVRDRLASEPETAALRDTVRPYRAGYLAAERREIEAQLFDGTLLGVVATSALELGVDIGGLDACVLNGFPGTVASMRQQMGRAGREQQRSLAVLVAGNDQLDQWFMSHPLEVFRRPPEPAVVNLANPTIAWPHLACAAYEQPLTEADEIYWGDELADGVREMVMTDRLVIRDGRAFWSGRGSPAPGIGIRSGTSSEFRIEDSDGRLVGTVDSARAFDTVHTGALYLHQGQQYRVGDLNIDERVATVTAVDVDEETRARSSMDISVERQERHDQAARFDVYLGAVRVTTQVNGYDRISTNDRDVIERVELDLPPSVLVTRAVWYTVPKALFDRANLDPEQVPGVLHAIEHAAIGILPLFTICDRWDVGGLSMAWHPETQAATIVIYDGYPGGAGIADLAFSCCRRHLEATLAVVERCKCKRGCPSCVQSPKCGNGNEPLDKAGAVALLRNALA